MQITFTNAGSQDVYVSALYKEIKVGESVTTRRALSELTRNQELMKFVEDGTITLAYATEDGDDTGWTFGHMLGAFTAATRPPASSLKRGDVIYNTTTNIPNWWDGAAWRDAAGTVV